jgi:hypothetical protein
MKKKIPLIIIIVASIISSALIITALFIPRPPSNGYLNDAPQIVNRNPSSNIVISEEESQLFEVSVVDPNNDSLTYMWTINGTATGSNSNSYMYVADYDSAGS